MIRSLLGVLILLSACGGSPAETDGSEITPAQAQQDCADFISKVYCPSFMRCLSGYTMADCLDTLPGFDCSTVTGENGRLPTCEAELKAGSCQQLVGDGSIRALPLSCTGVFHF